MVEIWIGNEQADYGGDIEVQYSLGDFRDFQTGNLNTSYDIDLPLTETNKRLLEYITRVSVFEEPNTLSRIYVNDVEIIRGYLKVLSYNSTYAKVIISTDNWMDEFKDKKLTDLDLSTYDKTYNSTNVVASWTAAAGEFMRFPLVYWGKLDMGGVDWYASDFLPWFNIRSILSKILSGYTISSTFFDSSYFKSIYILGKEPVKEIEYLDGKAMEVSVVDGDNQELTTVFNGDTDDVTLTKNPVIFNTITTQGHFSGSTDKYTIPEDGTYRFKFVYDIQSSFSGLTLNSASWTVKIIRDPLVGANVDLVTATGTTDSPNGTIDTGYIHLIDGDLIYCYATITLNLTNSGGVDRTAEIEIINSTFYSISDVRTLHVGLGYSIEPDKWLYDITQYDFIAAIKRLYNLRIWLNTFNKTIYLEPQPTFNTTEVKDISSLVDFTDHSVDLVSQSYTDKIRLIFKNDSTDFELNNYNTNNTVTLGEKLITLTSAYAQKGITTSDVLFSTFIKGIPGLLKGVDEVPRILRSYDPSLGSEPSERPTGLNIKIGEWKGATASASSWTYEGGTQTDYPKLDALDFSSLYTSYFMKMFHYIDMGKLITLDGVVDHLFINELQTVLTDSTKEGFRPLFKFYWQNEYHYGILNRYSTNGIRCKYELMLIK